MDTTNPIITKITSDITSAAGSATAATTVASTVASAADPVTAGLNLGDAIVMLIKGVIPTTPAQVACMQQFFPGVAARRQLRAQKIKEKQINQAAEYVKLHNLDPMQFAQYVNGSITFAELVAQDEKSLPIKK